MAEYPQEAWQPERRQIFMNATPQTAAQINGPQTGALEAGPPEGGTPNPVLKTLLAGTRIARDEAQKQAQEWRERARKAEEAIAWKDQEIESLRKQIKRLSELVYGGTNK